MKEILKRIRSEITPENWCKGSYACDITEQIALDATDPRACKWCLVGWLIKYCQNSTEFVVIRNWLTGLTNHYTLPSFNDAEETKIEDIYILLDRAISKET